MDRKRRDEPQLAVIGRSQSKEEKIELIQNSSDVRDFDGCIKNCLGKKGNEIMDGT